MKDLGEGFIT